MTSFSNDIDWYDYRDYMAVQKYRRLIDYIS